MALCFSGLGTWPWDHDEVPSLIELKLLDRGASTVSTGQLERLPRLIPVWYGLQSLVLGDRVPNEWNSRLLSATCGVLVVVSAFVLAARRYGLRFATALSIVFGGSQCFVWLSQQNRFYSMALLFLTWTWAAVWTRRGGARMSAAAATLAAMAILCHNLLVVVFVIGFVAACAAYAVGRVSRRVLTRCAAVAAVSVLLYLGYLRPIMRGWVSGGTGGTNSLVSFCSHAGIPTLALALFGVAATFNRGRPRKAEMVWWSLLFGGGLVFVAAAPLALSAWNPRYALLFMPPMWVLAAYGVERIARGLRPPLAVAWLTCVALLLLPKLASHFQDGSRHDFRSAARAVVRHAGRDHEILCNWPATLDYYLTSGTSKVQGFDRRRLPASECFLVLASNAYEPLLKLPDRKVELVEQLLRRRFDEQSHEIRIYRIGPANHGITSGSPAPSSPG